MSVNDDIKKAEEERIARLKNPLKPYGPGFTQLTPEQWAAITEETKIKEEEKKNRPTPPTKGQMGADAVKAKKYQDALEAIRNAKTDAEAAEAAAIAKELAPIGGTKTQSPYQADSADEQAKLDYLNNSPLAIPDDALSQRKWKNAFIPSGKLNELRSLFIANKFVTRPEDIKYLEAMKQASPNYADKFTRDIIASAVYRTTELNANIANAQTYGKRVFSTFKDFVQSYDGKFNIDDTKGSGGYQSPRYEKNVSVNNFDAGDIEIALDQMFQKYTGQGADAETAKLIADKLNAMAPQTTEIRRKGDNSVTTITGGVTAGDQALAMREQALADPQAENYNKATTFINYFRDALKAPIQLG